MSSGTPLNDADRLPWLALIRSTAERVCREQYESGDVSAKFGRPAVVIACSALKKWYRDILRGVVDADPPKADDLVRLISSPID
jgi:gluconokinase